MTVPTFSEMLRREVSGSRYYVNLGGRYLCSSYCCILRMIFVYVWALFGWSVAAVTNYRRWVCSVCSNRNRRWL